MMQFQGDGFPEVFCERGEICLLIPGLGVLAITQQQAEATRMAASVFTNNLAKALADQATYREFWGNVVISEISEYGERLARELSNGG